MIGPTDDATVALLRQALGRASLGAAVAASNLANVDTPGYRALRAEFPELLGRVGGTLDPERTEPGHLPAGGDGPAAGRLVEAPATRMRADGNSVDVDLEMTGLSRMQGRYRAAAALVRKRFALLRYAVTDGRGGG